MKNETAEILPAATREEEEQENAVHGKGAIFERLGQHPAREAVATEPDTSGDDEMTDLRDILLKLIEIQAQIIKGFDIVIESIEEMKGKEQ